MRVLIAPDKFKGTLTAREAADAIERGVLAAFPRASTTCIPLADGGEGTIDVLASGPGARREVMDVRSAEGSFEAPIATLGDGSVCVEVATTSGAVRSASALSATSRRTGEAIAAVAAQDPERILVAVGGSASTDGGTGIASATGWRFLDDRGEALADGGGALRRLARIERGRFRPLPVTGLCDVANPLLGAQGAARVFAPQKGASLEEVEALEEGLQRLSEVVRSELGIDVGWMPRGGAGGGIGAGLVAFLGAELVDGFGAVAGAAGFDAALDGADLVVTGEGRLDRGSLEGKVAWGVARRARARGIPVVTVCGELLLAGDEVDALGFVAAGDAVSIGGRAAAFEAPVETLELATRRVVESAAR